MLATGSSARACVRCVVYAARKLTNVRTVSTQAHRSIAIVGAGLSGLSHALYLARGLKGGEGGGGKHKIVLYESSNRTGGWVDSRRIDVGDGSTALIEKGPRSIRAVTTSNGLAMLELINSLGLSSELIDVSKEHPSAKNRMVWYNNELHKLPVDFQTLALAVTRRGHLLYDLFKISDIFTFARKIRDESEEQRSKRSAEWYDESVEDMMKRVLDTPGKESRATAIIDRTVSAALHGIYAADASQLSVRSVLPFLFNFVSSLAIDKRSWWPPWPFNIRMYGFVQAAAEAKAFPWVKRAYRKQQRETEEQKLSRKKLGAAVVDAYKTTSVVSFRDGVQTLTDALRDECIANGVELRLRSPVTSISMGGGGGKDDKATIRSGIGAEQFDRVISALPSSTLATLLQEATPPHLNANATTTVCVVNVIVPKDLGLRLQSAFGFLVPRIVDKNGENPLGLLGVVFDSVAVPGQDEHTKLTMMFGGPYWCKGYVMHDLIMNDPDGRRKAQEEARKLLDSILFQNEPDHPFSFNNRSVLTKLHVQRDCIPTYTPGHPHRMFELHEALCSPAFSPLSVIGASYTGVSLNDCVLYAKRTADRIIEAESANDPSANVSGLEEYSGE